MGTLYPLSNLSATICETIISSTRIAIQSEAEHAIDTQEWSGNQQIGALRSFVTIRLRGVSFATAISSNVIPNVTDPEK